MCAQNPRGLNFPGSHFLFINDRADHVLDLDFAEGKYRTETLSRYSFAFPEDKEHFAKTHDLWPDRMEQFNPANSKRS